MYTHVQMESGLHLPVFCNQYGINVDQLGGFFQDRKTGEIFFTVPFPKSRFIPSPDTDESFLEQLKERMGSYGYTLPLKEISWDWTDPARPVWSFYYLCSFPDNLQGATELRTRLNCLPKPEDGERKTGVGSSPKGRVEQDPVILASGRSLFLYLKVIFWDFPLVKAYQDQKFAELSKTYGIVKLWEGTE